MIAKNLLQRGRAQFLVVHYIHLPAEQVAVHFNYFKQSGRRCWAGIVEEIMSMLPRAFKSSPRTSRSAWSRTVSICCAKPRKSFPALLSETSLQTKRQRKR